MILHLEVAPPTIRGRSVTTVKWNFRVSAAAGTVPGDGCCANDEECMCMFVVLEEMFVSACVDMLHVCVRKCVRE